MTKESNKAWIEEIVAGVMLCSKGIPSNFISNLEKVGYKIVKDESKMPPIEKCKYCNGTRIIKDPMAGEWCVTDCIYCKSENERLKADREWVSVKTRLPEDSIIGGESVLCYMKNSVPFVGYLQNKEWRYSQTEKRVDVESGWVVTHWMPLPQSPKQ